MAIAHEQTSRECGHLRPRLRQRGVLGKSCDDSQVVCAPNGAWALFVREKGVVFRHELKAGRQNADDLVNRRAHAHGPQDWVAVEMIAPELVRDHQHLRAAESILIRGERSPDDRMHAEYLEEAARDAER